MDTNTKRTAIYTPKLSLYHPKYDACGSAIQFELVPAHGMEGGAIYCRIAGQVKNNNGLPRFDFENAITAKLGFEDICKIIQVLRGECESIEFAPFSFTHNTKVTLVNELGTGNYKFTFTQTDNEDNNLLKICFTLIAPEALGVCEAFSQSLGMIAFGTGFEATSIAIARDEEKKEALDKAIAEASKE